MTSNFTSHAVLEVVVDVSFFTHVAPLVPVKDTIHHPVVVSQ